MARLPRWPVLDGVKCGLQGAVRGRRFQSRRKPDSSSRRASRWTAKSRWSVDLQRFTPAMNGCVVPSRTGDLHCDYRWSRLRLYGRLQKGHRRLRSGRGHRKDWRATDIVGESCRHQLLPLRLELGAARAPTRPYWGRSHWSAITCDRGVQYRSRLIRRYTASLSSEAGIEPSVEQSLRRLSYV